MPSSKTSTVEDALEALEKALGLLHRKKYEDADKVFAVIEKESSEDIQLGARARVFRKVCRQKLIAEEPAQEGPGTAYDRGILAHNQGNYDEALTLFEIALAQDAESPHVHLAMAAAATCLGNFDEAISSLRKAIDGDPFNRVRVRRDSEFEPLRSHAGYLELTQAK